MNAAVASASARKSAPSDEVALSGRFAFEPAPLLPFSERLANGLKRTVTLGADAIVLTLASPFLLVFFAVRAVGRALGAGRQPK